MSSDTTTDAEDALAVLRERLRRLWREAGDPSARDIARRTEHSLSHTTANLVVRCEKVPRWGQLELIVEVLGGERTAFKQLWINARDAQERASEAGRDVTHIGKRPRAAVPDQASQLGAEPGERTPDGDNPRPDSPNANNDTHDHVPSVEPEPLRLRRVPLQGRSVLRVARMLDACAELVGAVGYEGLTTSLLAERAGVAIGSIYQFFPDKRAVVQALTQRNLETYLDRLTPRFEGSGPKEWDKIFDAAVDEYFAMCVDTPGFHYLAWGDGVDIRLLDEHLDNIEMVAVAITSFASRCQARHIPSEEIVAAALEITMSIVNRGIRRDPDGERRPLETAKWLGHQYVSRVGRAR